MQLDDPPKRRGRGIYCFTSVRLSVLPSVQDIFRRIFLSNYQWQKSDIWSQASYTCRYAILWVAFLDRSDSYFLFADLVGFYTHWTYMHLFRRIFLSNYWWHKSDIWSQASYRYPISWEAFLDPSDSYFLFAEEWGYHTWALAHSSSCFLSNLPQKQEAPTCQKLCFLFSMLGKELSIFNQFWSFIFFMLLTGGSSSWSYGSLIYNYQFYRSLSPLK